MTDLRQLASDALDWVRRQDPSLKAELYLARGQERSMERREGALDGVQESSAEGAGLRLIDGKRLAFASAGGLSLEAVQELYRRAKAGLPHVEDDPCRVLPVPASAPADLELAGSLWDPRLFELPWSDLEPKLQELEEAALAADPRVSGVLRSGYGESRGEVVVANTEGALSCERGASCSVGLSTICRRDDETQVGSGFQSARRLSDLDWAKTGRQSAERTVALLGARKLPGARRAVLFDPWVAGELLELVSSLLCADQVQKGKSLLAGKLGRKVGSELLSFVDDPRRPYGMASSLYDDEGVPTERKVMIEKGVVRQFFYDSYTAARDGVRDNGCAGRGSYKGLPSPGSSNFFLEPGARSRESLLRETKDGLLVLDIMGMHMADPISGEFSVGVSGLAVQGGELAFPVKNAMISGNLVDLLARVDAVASDLTFFGGMGAPTFRVADMEVA